MHKRGVHGATMGDGELIESREFTKQQWEVPNAFVLDPYPPSLSASLNCLVGSRIGSGRGNALRGE